MKHEWQLDGLDDIKEACHLERNGEAMQQSNLKEHPYKMIVKCHLGVKELPLLQLSRLEQYQVFCFSPFLMDPSKTMNEGNIPLSSFSVISIRLFNTITFMQNKGMTSCHILAETTLYMPPLQQALNECDCPCELLRIPQRVSHYN